MSWRKATTFSFYAPNISWSQLSEQYGKGKARIFQDQFSKFVDGGLSTCVMHVTDPLSKNKLPVFHHAVKAPTNGKHESCLLTISVTGKQLVTWFKYILPRIELQTATSEASHLVDTTFLDGAVVV